jgi:hypothetical protein
LVAGKLESGLAIAVFLLVANSVCAYGLPRIAAEFYGNVTKNRLAVQADINVTVYDQDNVFCGIFAIRTP